MTKQKSNKKPKEEIKTLDTEDDIDFIESLQEENDDIIVLEYL